MAKYDIFISYSRLDQKIANKITYDLIKRGYSVWIDHNEIHSGDQFKLLIVNAILQSKLLIYISSRHSNNSPWTIKEISVALKMNIKVLPVRIDRSNYNPVVLFDLVNIDFISLFDENNKDNEYRRLIKSVDIHFSNQRHCHETEHQNPTQSNEAEKLYEKAIKLKYNKHECHKYEILMRKAAKMGFLKAQINLAVYLLKSQSIKYENEGFQWLQHISKCFNIEPDLKSIVFYNLGRCYELGIGTIANEDDSISCYRKAARIGHQIAQFKMGQHLESIASGDFNLSNIHFSQAIN